MKCTVCTNPITKKNRSPVKGVCMLDFRAGSARATYRLNEPYTYGRILHDTPPSPTPELFERHVASLKARHQYEIEALLTPEQEKDLQRIRDRKISSVNIALPFREASLIPPMETPPAKMVLVDLSEEELLQLETLRQIKRYEGR